jgi:endonuclease-8
VAEGPLVHHYARRLARVPDGQRVAVELRPRTLLNADASLKGILVLAVEAYGKQFQIRFADGRVLLVHLMMWGSWRIYRKGARWDKGVERARAIVRTSTHEVVVFSAPVVRILTDRQLDTDPNRCRQHAAERDSFPGQHSPAPIGE